MFFPFPSRINLSSGISDASDASDARPPTALAVDLNGDDHYHPHHPHPSTSKGIYRLSSCPNRRPPPLHRCPLRFPKLISIVHVISNHLLSTHHSGDAITIHSLLLTTFHLDRSMPRLHGRAWVSLTRCLRHPPTHLSSPCPHMNEVWFAPADPSLPPPWMITVLFPIGLVSIH